MGTTWANRKLARHRRNFRMKTLPKMHELELRQEIVYLKGRLLRAADPTNCFPPAEVRARLHAAQSEWYERYARRQV